MRDRYYVCNLVASHLELYQKIDDFVRLLRGEIAGEVCEGRMLHVYQGAVVLGCQWHQFFGSDSEGGILRVNSEYVVRSEETCLVSNFSLCSSLSEISALCLMPLKFCMICWS